MGWGWGGEGVQGREAEIERGERFILKPNVTPSLLQVKLISNMHKPDLIPNLLQITTWVSRRSRARSSARAMPSLPSRCESCDAGAVAVVN